MSLAEERIKELVEAMTDDEKHILARYLESEYMREELIKRHINRGNLNIDLRRNLSNAV